MLAPHGTEERRVAEGEDATVGTLEPVTTAVSGGGDPQDRRVEVGPEHGSVRCGVAVVRDVAVPTGEPVPLVVVGRCDAADEETVGCRGGVALGGRVPEV